MTASILKQDPRKGSKECYLLGQFIRTHTCMAKKDIEKEAILVWKGMFSWLDFKAGREGLWWRVKEIIGGVYTPFVLPLFSPNK